MLLQFQFQSVQQIVSLTVSLVHAIVDIMKYSKEAAVNALVDISGMEICVERRRFAKLAIHLIMLQINAKLLDITVDKILLGMELCVYVKLDLIALEANASLAQPVHFSMVKVVPQFAQT